MKLEFFTNKVNPEKSFFEKGWFYCFFLKTWKNRENLTAFSPYLL
ncbi:hypothetical protein LEP1GSC188_0965 [Leptospira weilii serovar Topaz str. LT2116]|uniref:Uncharacterized protein n=1 Tax=Leptospira weilii serovar Topaz str. LT2116 TaxID=1088540 RepID=M3GZE4_9LEPT|nr:hypothetical protein LEP1GSC188_0965 [Leptospira weilii serovar Topaz str. LT2116]